MEPDSPLFLGDTHAEAPAQPRPEVQLAADAQGRKNLRQDVISIQKRSQLDDWIKK
jgi:hypothetical protein